MLRSWIGMVGIVISAVLAGCAVSDVVDSPSEEAIAELARYDVEERAVRFEAAGIDVHGTLTVPEGVDDAPGVVLVAGSGATDRNWNSPLLPGDGGTAIELSQRLGEAGIAVLRYDKRGTGESEYSGAIEWSDYLAEVEQAVSHLADVDEVDERRVVLAGHSEGGAHAIRAVADGRVDVAGMALLSTAGRSTADLVIDEVTKQLEDAGVDQAVIDIELARLEQALESVSRGHGVNPAQVSEIPGLVSLFETFQQEETREFAAQMLRWDPVSRIRQIDEPIVIVNGLKDLHIDGERDGRRLYEAAKESHDDVELALLPQADHVLKYQSIPIEELRPQHGLTYNHENRRLDEAALQVMVDWVRDL